MDALRAALGPDEFPSHHGKVYDFEELGQRPRPAQDRIPVWVGGSSPAAVRRAAVRGDGWLPQGDPRDRLPAQIARLRRLREEAGITTPLTVGAITEPLYVGEPDWEVGRRTSPAARRPSRSRCGRTGQWGWTRSRCGSGAVAGVN